MWQTFTVENYGGRVILSGDAVFLKAHTGKFIDVQGVEVQARWSDRGNWQKLIIENKVGTGAIIPGDSIFLRSHTGMRIEVEGGAVRARWSDRGAWQTLVIKKSTLRRLSETRPDASSLQAILGIVARSLVVVALPITAVWALAWKHAKVSQLICSCKVQPFEEDVTDAC